MESKGYIQIYTGNGKGKTTAALGLALRAAGRNLRVFFGQFVKGMPYGEHRALEKYRSQIRIEQFGRECFINRSPEKEDIDAARKGWDLCRKVLTSGEYDLIVLDEIGIALYYCLITPEELKAYIKEKPENVELVLTGRKIPEDLFPLADLVTEMREVKHYYTLGVEAREGIEF